jgi:adenylyl-sulfate kinase
MESGCTLWFTGLSGSGKSTLSSLVATRLRAMGARVEVIDGDVVRTQLCHGLGFSKDDRTENIRRIGFVCELLSRNGVIAIAAAISPYQVCRDELRSRIENFIEVYMHCPLDVLVQRDVKGLYKKALAGEIPHFTGISDPYEPPPAPEVTIDSSKDSLEDSVASILHALEERGIIARQPTSATTSMRH